MAELRISEEEYQTWVTPSAALKSLRFSGSTSQIYLGARMESGVIRTACQQFGSSPTGAFMILPPLYWHGHPWIADTHFWETGDAQFYDSSAHEFGGPTTYHAFLVRLEPSFLYDTAAVTAVAGEPAPAHYSADPSLPEGPKSPLARAELTRFGELLTAVYPDATEALATRIVRAMYPNAAISRDQIRDLLPPRKPGRPASRGKNRE